MWGFRSMTTHLDSTTSQNSHILGQQQLLWLLAIWLSAFQIRVYTSSVIEERVWSLTWAYNIEMRQRIDSSTYHPMLGCFLTSQRHIFSGSRLPLNGRRNHGRWRFEHIERSFLPFGKSIRTKAHILGPKFYSRFSYLRFFVLLLCKYDKIPTAVPADLDLPDLHCHKHTQGLASDLVSSKGMFLCEHSAFLGAPHSELRNSDATKRPRTYLCWVLVFPFVQNDHLDSWNAFTKI